MTDKSAKLTLHDCAKRKDLNRLTKLLNDGWQVDERDEKGQTALFIAAWLGCIEIITILIGRGADVNVKNNDRETPLHKSALQGHNEIVRMLIDSGADVNVKDKRRQTPLHFSAVSGHTETVKLLIRLGAGTELADESGDTPLVIAEHYGHSDIVKLLREAKSKQAGNNRSSTVSAGFLGYSSSKKKVSIKRSDDKGQVTEFKYVEKEVRGSVVGVIDTSETKSKDKVDVVKVGTLKHSQGHQKQGASPRLSSELATSATPPTSASAAKPRNEITGCRSTQQLIKAAKSEMKPKVDDGGVPPDQVNGNAVVINQKTVNNHYHNHYHTHCSTCSCSDKQTTREEVKMKTSETFSVRVGNTRPGPPRPPEGDDHGVKDYDNNPFRNCIREDFVKYVQPANVMWLFHKYDRRVLTENDIQRISAKTCAEGPQAGAQLLLNRLPLYENWFPCLIQVLQDQHVKLGHVAKAMQVKVNALKKESARTWPRNK